MAGESADRNLLFGVLALQMDFISREALIAAVSAWVARKDRPLDEILVEQGAISAARRSMLEPLVAEHVKAHDDDPARSLASFDSIGTVRTDLERVTDADLHASLDRLDSISTRDGSSLETRAPSVGTATSSGLRFRILRPHDQGGLGIVSVAYDGELNREVALKEIRDKHADDEDKRSRFLLEAEITGGLEHPGVVPVYGLGRYEDGRPFYAMRFIKGDSLKHAIAKFHRAESGDRGPGDRAFQLRELLGRFVDVCNAMAYAHSRGVLHRDLKPGNVMLGPFGETLVVDWGLAKPVDRAERRPESGEAPLRPPSAAGSAVTLMGSAVGTPAYMSPEQAEGRLDELGPATDVYSLGATLYHVLCGRAAFEQEQIGTLLQAVVRGEFPAPRRIDPEVPPALEAVCLKAMARDPAARYASALELAGEIKAWLAGEPVTAYREPWADRAARWARRHKTPVAGVATLLVTAVVALAIGLVLVRREQGRTRFQRDLADRNFRKAREAADGFLTRISDDTQLAQPGLQPLRRRLLEAGVSYYEDFAKEGLDPGDHARLADAYARVARTNVLVGSSEKALANYADALRYYEAMAKARPDDPGPARLVVETLGHLGKIQLDSGRMAESLGSLERARGMGERLAARDQGVAARRARATIATELGDWRQKSYDRAGAVESHRRAVELFEAIAGDDPADDRAKSDLAASLAHLGAVQVELLRPDDALAAFRRARELREAILARTPGDSEQETELATLDHYVAAIQLTRRDFTGSLASLRRAKARRDEVIAANSVVAFQEALAKDLEDLAMAHRFAGNLPEALASAGRSREIAEQLIRYHPGVPRFAFGLAKSYIETAKAQLAGKQGPEARRSFEKAAEILRDQVIAKSAEAEPRLYLAAVADSIGRLGPAIIPPDDALRSYQEALAIRLRLVADHPEDIASRNALGNSYTNLGTVKAESGQLEEGIADFRRACEVREAAIRAHPDDLNTRSMLGVAHHNLGLWLMKTGQAPAALRSLEKAAEEQRKALDAAPQDPSFRDRLGLHLKQLAALRRQTARPTEAAAASLDRQRLWPDDPAALYQSARELALCLPIAGLADPEQVAAEAVAALRRAFDRGFRDLKSLRSEKDLDPLRRRDDFGRLMGELEANPAAGPAPEVKSNP